MTDNLSQLMTEFADDLAPSPEGMLEQARRGARRVRRRRRITAVVVAVLLAAVVVVPLRFLGGGASRTPYVTPSPSPSAFSWSRGPLELNVELAPREYLIIGRAQSYRYGRGYLTVVDPGAFDPTPLLGGEPVTLGNRTGYYLSDPPTDSGPRLVALRDPSGAWLLVSGEDLRDGLLNAAAQVRLGPPRPLAMPFRLGYRPPGIDVGTARVDLGGAPGWAQTNLGFGGSATAPIPSMFDWGREGSQLIVNVSSLPAPLEEMLPDEPNTTVAGRPAWWYERPVGRVNVGPKGALLAVRFPTCLFTVTVLDRARFPRAELERIVAGADVRDCRDRSTWVAPL
ncbi:hypothetical protein Val02_69740 [Virgisporangium aliadipatigenens]|uniref:Uncharacterized protein n=1 Tax=Virgisporangium aliadipatigenens TaxID=741659 RepID=A0A8J3YTE3_9ACTN|nr:hypothetical protein [Virgisporangium aliadipatigenens]GIJ50088.1 hypothetical protein Val02_69740 [Virgisporangium aliadipatigenens]